MKIKLFPPLPVITGGNRITAGRWKDIFVRLGHETMIEEPDNVSAMNADLLIFFNAVKSARQVAKLKSVSPENRPCVVVVLSGTDLEPQKLHQKLTQSAVDFADALVTYEDSALNSLSPRQIKKTVVVPHSAVESSQSSFSFENESAFHIISVSHIRPEKNLAAYFECLINFSKEKQLQFHHIGGTIDQASADHVKSLAIKVSNLHLYGKIPHSETMAMIAAADLLIHPSIVEGFPNVVVEAIVNGTAVALSRIAAHQATFSGGLPKEYFFGTDCREELKTLLEKFATDSNFREKIKRDCLRYRPRFESDVEIRGIVELLHRLALK